MPVIILAGGLGTRIREFSEFKPKPMVEIGGKPILWHLMSHLSYYGFHRFIVCVGYKGHLIREFFQNYKNSNNDFTISLDSKQEFTFHSKDKEFDWSVTIAETGDLTNTGGRIFKAQEYLLGEEFICTYGDGLSDLDFKSLVNFHHTSEKIVTLTAVRPLSRFGILEIDKNGSVTSFNEKRREESWVNGGFFVFKPQIFDYLSSDSILETTTIQMLTTQNQVSAFKHEGFWQPMDTFKESRMLNEIWNSGQAPWKMRN